jgi:hypothetical protein
MKPYTTYVERPKTRHYYGIDLEDIRTHALPSRFGKAKWGESRSPLHTKLKKAIRRSLTKKARNAFKKGVHEDY